MRVRISRGQRPHDERVTGHRTVAGQRLATGGGLAFCGSWPVKIRNASTGDRPARPEPVAEWTAVRGGTGDLELTLNELRVVTRFAVESAEEVLPLFEQADPDDSRPRAAIAAAWTFANGAARTKLQRVTALDAHRASNAVADEAAQHAARAAGDAAAAAYLHPLAEATQVGHILRAAANAARAAELSAGGDPNAGTALIEETRLRAAPTLIDVLSRYPFAPNGKSRVAHFMKILDTSLRSPR